jgi:hypothetical protein
MAQDASPHSDSELTSALQLLGELLPADELEIYSFRHSPATVYTNLLTVWMMVLQRLGGGLSLEQTVKQTLSYYSEVLPDNKRVREKTLSQSPSAFWGARQSLSLSSTEHIVDCVTEALIQRTPESPWGGRTFLLDGTTITLAPTSELRRVYPPARNQHGESVWPLMMLCVAHEASSGVALRPEFGAMYGDQKTSEARQAIAMAQRIPAGSLIVMDCGYGIFQVIYPIRQLGHQVLARLTKSRFKALRRAAELIEQNAQSKRYRLKWRCSTADRKASPELPTDAQLDVELHDVELDNGEHLYLVTSLEVGSAEAAERYALRYTVEHDIRDVKVTLRVESILARSDQMVRKEVLCSVIAYNLFVQVRRQAARMAGIAPRRLSFKRVWTTVQTCLLHQPSGDVVTWQARYARALAMASRDKLPNRPGRSYPRKAHKRCPKSTKFMGTKPQAAAPEPAHPPP